MRNMKKLLATMLALTLLASTAGCSSPVKGTSEPSTETKANVAETAGQKASDEMTIPVAEVNERNGKGHETVKTFLIEEQEAFNDKYAIVTVPEQNFDWHTDTWQVDFTVELKDTGEDISESAWGVAIREVYVNEELIYTGELSPNKNQCGPNNPYNMDIELEKTELDILNNSTTEDSEISFNLIIAGSMNDTIEEITVTIPVTIKTDN